MHADIAKILDYQKIDGELIKLEKEIESNKDKEMVAKMIGIVKESQKQAETLEQGTGISVAEFDKVKKIYEENYEKAKKLTSIDIDKLKEEEKELVVKELETILNTLNIVEKKLMNLSKNVEKISKDFETAKQNAWKARTQYKKSKEAYDTFVSSKKESTDKLNAELSKLAPRLNTSLFVKYKALRQDKVFPIFVPLTTDLCGACRMKPSVVMINKLKEQGCIECEHCHRLIYAE